MPCGCRNNGNNNRNVIVNQSRNVNTNIIVNRNVNRNVNSGSVNTNVNANAIAKSGSTNRGVNTRENMGLVNKNVAKSGKYRKTYNFNDRLNQYYFEYRREIYKDLSEEDIKSWKLIHNKAADATTNQKIIEFDKYIKFLSYNYPCPVCKKHIKKRLLSHPVKMFSSIINGKNVGLAKWSWEFHNDVNERLGKQIMPWEEFEKEYIK